MHDFDTSIPQFVTQVQGTRIVVTPDIIFEILHVLRVLHPDYPACPCLRTMSKDELMSLFYETPSSWDECQNTSCLGFAKGLRFLNMVMTFALHPLSHYNSITEPHAHLLLSFIEELTIDFPFHFILSLIDVYKDTVTRDKLIFPSAIMRIIHHSFIPYPESSHFTNMGAVSEVSIRWSKAQLCLKQPHIETMTPLAPSIPSTFAPSSSIDGMTLEAIMAQLERMDARLDTLSTELYQMNTRVSRIARRQAHMGGFAVSPSPSPSTQASEDKDADDGSDNDDDDEDEDASSSSDEEMTTSQWLTLCHL